MHLLKRALFGSALFAAAAFLLAGAPARADIPGAHGYYRHALADLRLARGLINVNSYAPGTNGNEDRALTAIDAAIGHIKQAGFDDGKPMHFGIPVDPGIDHPGRLHRALQALRDARSDADREEQNWNATVQRNRATRDIDTAIRHVELAIHDNDRARM